MMSIHNSSKWGHLKSGVAFVSFVAFAVVLSSGAPKVAAAEEEAAPAAEQPAEPKGPPKIAESFPKVGESEVDPGIIAILVTFDRDMSDGMSWTGGGEFYPKLTPDQKPEWRDKRTCAFPVDLEEGRFYRIGINSTGYKNFRSEKGIPVDPAVIYFTTIGATDETKKKLEKPKIVRIVPQRNASGIDPKTNELKVTFDIPMSDGISWTGSGPNHPTLDRSRRPHWTADHKTFIVPVKLKPKWSYRIGINSASFNNFQSEPGVPLDPVIYSFSTGK